jgi:PIN domain nuclease of toxin-antitoxin system
LNIDRLPKSETPFPADRQIIACARTHGLTLLTADQRILDWKHVSSFDPRK